MDKRLQQLRRDNDHQAFLRLWEQANPMPSPRDTDSYLRWAWRFVHAWGDEDSNHVMCPHCPKFHHWCDGCTFLESIITDDGWLDVYICTSSLVARYSNIEENYISHALDIDVPKTEIISPRLAAALTVAQRHHLGPWA